MKNEYIPLAAVLNLDKKPITGINPGQEVLCPGFVGDYFKLTMGDDGIARSSTISAVIAYSEYYKVFIVLSLLDNTRILNVEF